MEKLLGGNSLRIEQIPEALCQLELFSALAGAPGIGIEWAKQLADSDPHIELGSLCVAWALAVDRQGEQDRGHSWSRIESNTREKALELIKDTGGEPVNLKENEDPLIRLAWLATRIQKRRNIRDSTNKQLLCWKLALDFLPERAAQHDTGSECLGPGSREHA